MKLARTLRNAGVYEVKAGILERYTFAKEAYQKMGCPLLMDVYISADSDDCINFDLAWFCKPATRVAEALWCGFRPIASNKQIIKLGLPVDPKNVVSKGQCRLHAANYGVAYDQLDIETLDTALVAPQEPSLLNFTDVKPLDDDGINLNLYNNIWGTNFPMWCDEDARFRFRIHLK